MKRKIVFVLFANIVWTFYICCFVLKLVLTCRESLLHLEYDLIPFQQTVPCWVSLSFVLYTQPLSSVSRISVSTTIDVLKHQQSKKKRRVKCKEKKNKVSFFYYRLNLLAFWAYWANVAFLLSHGYINQLVLNLKHTEKHMKTEIVFVLFTNIVWAFYICFFV